MQCPASSNTTKVGISVTIVLVVAAIVMTVCLVTFNGGDSAESSQMEQLCEEYFQWRLKDKPEYATSVGVHDYDRQLDNLSLAAYDQRLEVVKEFLGRVELLEGSLTLHSDVTNVQVLRDELEIFIDGFQFKNFYMALNNMGGIQKDILRLLTFMPHKTVEDYNIIITRLGELPIQVLQIIELMRAGVQEGIMLHEHSMNKVLNQTSEFIVTDSEESPIYKKNFATFPESFTDDEKFSLQSQAKDIISTKVVPAFQNLYNYIKQSYVTRDNIAISSLPNGEQLYLQIIRFHTGKDDTPSDLHQRGIKEVERIEGLMQEIVYERGFINMSVQNFSAMIRDDENNYYSTEEELLDGFRHIVYNITTPVVSKIFKNLPEAEIEVKGDTSGTGAYYNSGSVDGTRPATFYVGTQDVGSIPKFGMLTLSLHEGNPGHHLQISRVLESPSLKDFRKYGKSGIFSHAPSMFPSRTYYIEGWALYAESTGFDLELFSDSLDRYGHYAAEVFRAARLVVDTGIHALGMSRDQAIQYLRDHTARTKLNIENEIDRYITWPGQALAYKTGELQITEMRKQAEERLGDRFDIKDFHEVVLESVGPMSLVKEEVENWVEEMAG